MKFDFRLKLFVVSLGLTVFAFLGADLWLAPSFEDHVNERVHESASVLLGVLALEAASSSAAGSDRPSWDALARELGLRARARVTFVGRDGAVLGDSEVGEAARGLGDVGARPEVQRALARAPSDPTVDATEDEDGDSFAVPFVNRASVGGVVRLALPIARRNATNWRIEKLVLIESGVVCAATILLWFGAAGWLSRLLRKLTAAAREMAAGRLDVRTRIAGTDEVAELGEALDKLAGTLSEAMGDLVEERDLQVAILDGLQEGVLVLGQDRAVLRHNPASRSMLPFATDASGSARLDLAAVPDLAALIAEAEADGRDARAAEIEVGGPPSRRLLATAVALADAPRSLLLVFRDVTEMRRLENVRRDFVANMSHELRTPIALIRSAGETLGGAATRRPEAMGRFVEIVSRNADRLQHLVDEVLDLSRIESRHAKLTTEPVSLRAFVEQTLSVFEARAQEQRVTFDVQIDGAHVVTTDRGALEQVLMNLVDNALKYCPGATVRVASTEDARGTEVRIEDSGPGIPEADLPRIFERFYRVDAGRSRDLGGAGLGLSIVKHLVERMHGEVAVKSTPGRGSTFTVLLPRHADTPS